MSIRVLLVDDNALFREGIAEILRKDGRFTVAGHASRGDEAVTAAATLAPDLILMDWQMPGMTGIEAIEQVRRRDPSVPIGVLTMFESPEHIQTALAAGASGYLPKDATPVDLCEGAAALARGARDLVTASESPHPDPLPAGKGKRTSLQGVSEIALTPRELQVLRALAGQGGNAEIARRLGISASTLRSHIRRTYEKLRVHDRAQAVLVAVRQGLIDASAKPVPRGPVTGRDQP